MVLDYVGSNPRALKKQTRMTKNQHAATVVQEKAVLRQKKTSVSSSWSEVSCMLDSIQDLLWRNPAVCV